MCHSCSLQLCLQHLLQMTQPCLFAQQLFDFKLIMMKVRVTCPDSQSEGRLCCNWLEQPLDLKERTRENK